MTTCAPLETATARQRRLGCAVVHNTPAMASAHGKSTGVNEVVQHHALDPNTCHIISIRIT
jgi:hypothetical protein